MPHPRGHLPGMRESDSIHKSIQRAAFDPAFRALPGLREKNEMNTPQALEGCLENRMIAGYAGAREINCIMNSSANRHQALLCQGCNSTKTGFHDRFLFEKPCYFEEV